MLEIAAAGTTGFAAPAQAWLQRGVLKALLTLPGIVHVDIYAPLDSDWRDPFVAGAAVPLAVAMAHFRTEAALGAALASDALNPWLGSWPPGLIATATPMSRKIYAVDEPPGGARREPCRYVVRYHGPGDQAAGFAERYERTHPPLLASLPRIRAIECYRPVATLRAPHCEPADYLIGNEVEFDSVEDFNAAMASPARIALRADFEALPRVFRDNTHFATRLERHHAHD